jgi:hypothetical protein
MQGYGGTVAVGVHPDLEGCTKLLERTELPQLLPELRVRLEDPDVRRVEEESDHRLVVGPGAEEVQTRGHRDNLSPIHDGTVVRVISLPAFPVVTDLIGQSVFVELDTKPWTVGQIQITLPNDKRLFQVTFAQAHLLLA